MSKEFMNLGKEYRAMYEVNINQMLQEVYNDERFEEPIRNLCNYALTNNWELSKKVNIINIITK